MLKDKIVSSIKEALGILSDDQLANLPDSLIMFEYSNARATFIEQIFSKGGRYNDSDLNQVISVELEYTDNATCGNVPSRCKILKSKNKLPSNIIYVHGRHLISYVGSPNPLNKGFFVVDYSRIRNVQSSERIVQNSVMAFILNGYLYIFGTNAPILANLENVTITAIFEDPETIMQSGLCIENCNNYPIKAQYHTYISEMVIKKLMTNIQFPSDQINDASNQLYQPQPKQKVNNE